MLRLLCMFALGIVLTVSVACAKEGRPNDGGDNTQFYLSPNELKELTDKANVGDTKAAIRLHLYYDLDVNDGPKAMAWLRKAVDEVDAEAEYRLGVIHESGGPDHNPALAKYWIERSEKHGYFPPPPAGATQSAPPEK